MAIPCEQARYRVYGGQCFREFTSFFDALQAAKNMPLSDGCIWELDEVDNHQLVVDLELPSLEETEGEEHY